jgi:hypothetical protein
MFRLHGGAVVTLTVAHRIAQQWRVGHVDSGASVNSGTSH